MLMHSSARGKGEAVLLIHGMPTNGRLWDRVVKELGREYQCIVIDLPGMGASPALAYGPSYFAQVSAQIEQVRRWHNVQRWHVVGHDAGSAVAVHYAHLFSQRVNCLALLSPSIFPDLRPYFVLNVLRKPLLGELLAPIVNTVFWRIVMSRAVPGEDHAELRASFSQTFSGMSGSWKLMRLVRWGEPEVVLHDSAAILAQMQCPALILHGTRDVLPESFARRAAALLRNSQLLGLDSGHFIPIEQGTQVARHLAAFFLSRGAERLDDLPRYDDAELPPHMGQANGHAAAAALFPQPAAH
jgi:pimeloyl-ACP methyl ester carboxylesterase